MDNDTFVPPEPGPGLPRTSTFSPGLETGASASRDDYGSDVPLPLAQEAADRTGVFGRLVQDDGDIAGLVAYSIYKQHKLDWLRAFEQAKGRAPGEAELFSYIIGEATPRRLATYRHLAEATLAGNGPDVEGGGARRSRAAGTLAPRRLPVRGTLAPTIIVTYGLIAILFLAGFWLALHFTVATR